MNTLAGIDLNSRIVIPANEFERFLMSLNWTWQQAARREVPEPFTDLEELQLACISDDPYLWCTANLKEPTDPVSPEDKAPHAFWDYQVTSLRWKGSFVHYDAAEVGKTREIAAKSLYLAFNTPYGSGLIGAPETKFLRPIIKEIEDQLDWNPELRADIKYIEKAGDLVTNIIFKNGFKLHFRHSSHDGKPYRGVHVKTFAFKDEAAKDHNQATWSEFYRAMEPSCILGLYSVPDGNLLEFWRRGQEAKQTTASKPLKDFTHTDLRLFNWAKTIMPPPYWSPERRLHSIKQYQGETHPDYLHNVLGQDGDPESSVFPWVLLERCIKHIPEYRCLNITATDNGYSVIGYDIDGQEPRFLLDRIIPSNEFKPSDIIRQFFTLAPGLSVCFMGADLAYKPDPSEFYVKAVIGNAHRLIARVKLQGIEYPEQTRIWDALDDVYDAGKLETQSGIDAGNAGTSFYQFIIDNFPKKNYHARMFPIQMGSKHPELDSMGNPIMDKHTDKPITRRAKTLATKMIHAKLLDQTMEYPADPDIVRLYPTYTARKGSDGDLIYSEKDDHHIAADQAAEFAFGRLSDPEPDIAGIQTSGVAFSTGSASGVFLNG